VFVDRGCHAKKYGLSEDRFFQGGQLSIDYCTKIETKVSPKILLVESSKNIKFFAAQIQIPLPNKYLLDIKA
jgi:hypothetical protein